MKNIIKRLLCLEFATAVAFCGIMIAVGILMINLSFNAPATNQLNLLMFGIFLCVVNFLIVVIVGWSIAKE